MDFAINYDPALCEIFINKTLRKKSNAWKYFGHLKYEHKIMFPERNFCKECLEQGKFKSFAASTSTSALKRHLESEEHKISINEEILDNKQTKLKFSSTQNSEENDSETKVIQDSDKLSSISKSPTHLKFVCYAFQMCLNEILDTELMLKERGLQNILLKKMGYVRNVYDVQLSDLHGVQQEFAAGLKSKIADDVGKMVSGTLKLIELNHDKFENIVLLFLDMIDDDWKYKTYFLGMKIRACSEAEKVNIPIEWIKEMLIVYDIINKPLKFVANQACNIRRNICGIECIGETFGGIIRDSCFDDMKEILKKITTIYETFYFYSFQTNYEKVFLEEEDLIIVQTLQNFQKMTIFIGGTKHNEMPPWFVQKDIIERFLQQKDHFDSLLEDLDKLALLPKKEEIKKLEVYMSILRCFDELVDHIYSADEPFTSKKMLMKKFLHDKLSAILDKAKDQTMKRMIKKVTSNFDKSINITEEDIIGAVLDVRVKDLVEMEKELKNIKITKKNLLIKYLQKEEIQVDTTDESNIDLDVNLGIDTTQNSTSKAKKKKSKSRGQSKGLYPQTISPMKKKDGTDEEIDKYIEYRCSGKVKSALEWWQENEKEFKNIAVLAKKYMKKSTIQPKPAQTG